MKPHPRIRKTIKWGVAVVTVLLVVVWAASFIWFFGWSNVGNGSAYFGGGGLQVTHFNGAGFTGAPSYGRGDYSIVEVCVIPRVYDLKGAWALVLPLWLPIGVASAGTAAAWRLDTLARHRAKLNLCPKCHYDRTGLAAGAVCPECGVGGVGGSVSAKS